MTALAGFWRFEGGNDASLNCERMLQSQQVHAPDPARLWDGGNIAVGRRLYRLLPEDRFDQGPVVSADGRRILVADVRLDNREDLCLELAIPRAEADRLADAAIVMKAIERWDEGAVDRLVGDFAFACWEPGSERLLLARDFMGTRPLHFHRCRDFFAFATMPKGLHALPEIPRVPNPEAAANFVALVPEAGSETFFEGIEKVLPGHILTVTRGRISTRKHWQPVTDELRMGSSDDYVEGLREQLDRAVAAQLRGADGRVAATLSGGLDSTAVAATAARVMGPSGGRVVAITAAPREGYAGRGVHQSFIDESGHAAKVAALYPNMEHVIVRAGAGSPLEGLDRYFYLYERPFLNLCNGVWNTALQQELKSRRLTVLLTGMAGNMSLSYSGLELLTQYLATGRWLRLVREAILLRRKGTRLGTVAAQAFGPFLPESLWHWISRLRGKGIRLTDYTAIHPEAVERLELRRRSQARGLDFSYRPRRDPVEARLWVLGRVDHGNYNKGALAAWGIDGRDPTADRRLVEFCLRVPVDQYLRDGVTRSLARRALADRVPDEIVRETRKGYQAADWHEALSLAREEVREELERFSQVSTAAELLDTEMMRQLIVDWPDGGWHQDRVIGKYRLALLRGVSAGHFLRRASGSNQ